MSLSIPASRKPWLFRRMRAAASPERALPAALAGTILLAVGVSLLETPCTAGLPVLWTSLLEEAGVSTGQAAGLFGAYMAVFLLDALLVFGAAVVTLRAAKVQERHGRLSSWSAVSSCSRERGPCCSLRRRWSRSPEPSRSSVAPRWC